VTDGAYELSSESSQPDAAIFSRADLCINGSGTLRVSGLAKHGVVSKDDLVLANCTLVVSAVSTALDGKDCVKASGTNLTVTAGSNGLRSDNAEDESRGFVYLKDCTLSITSGSDGVQAQTVLQVERSAVTVTAGGGASQRIRYADGSWKGLKSGGDMLLSGGTYTISSRDDCIHSNSSIVIADGIFSLSSGDDGVHADTDLTICGGEITIHQSYEGLEASKLTIAGGHIDVTASDDGLNAAGGADGSAMGNRFGRSMFSNGVGEIIISGGYTVVRANGDGIDSNGSITVSGGVTLVSGPTNSGNAAFDYDGSAAVNGGILIATGPMGMAQNFSTAENQGAMLISFNQQQSGKTIALTDDKGVVLASFTPAASYQSAVITAPGVQQGQRYSLLTGCTVEGADEYGFAQNTTVTGGVLIEHVTMDSLIYGGNGGFGMWQRPNQRQNNNQKQNRPGGDKRPGW
ncbi:MAG: carbohydrate-binding domain-containing protein, partial [Clostridia bacterium]|nr:carbohydrate-binding domain-containing protein [Clostridia bacterium]